MGWFRNDTLDEVKELPDSARAMLAQSGWFPTDPPPPPEPPAEDALIGIASGEAFGAPTVTPVAPDEAAAPEVAAPEADTADDAPAADAAPSPVVRHAKES